MSKRFAILRIRNGDIENKRAIRELFNELKDGKWLLEIAQYNKRSDSQNRYYFGIVVPLVQEGIKHLGHQLTKEETHDFLKSRFHSQEIVNEDTGEVIHIPRSTTIMNKERFSEYIGEIQRFSAEFLNIVIPDPGQQMMMEV